MSKEQDYYQSMLNVMTGLEDDIDANGAPEEARVALRELIEICQSDYRIRFGAEGIKS